MNLLLSVRSFVRKHKVLVALACLVLVGWAFFAIKDWVERPTDLGQELEYIGKDDSWCGRFPIFICVEPKYSVYYFATNMGQEELKAYFKKAQFVGQRGGTWGVDYSSVSLYFKPDNAEEFGLEYYDKPQVVITEHNLKSTGKLYVISITEYKLARESL